MIKSVKIQGNGFLVNNNTFVSVDEYSGEYRAVEAWISEGNIPEPEFNEAEVLTNIARNLEDVAQHYIEKEATSRGYDSIVSACSYAGYPNVYQDEAISLGVFRSAVWTYMYQVQTDVQSGIRAIPTEAELLLELPKVV